MAIQLTHMAMSLFTIGAVDYLGYFSAMGFNPEQILQEGAGVTQRYGISIPVKKKLEWTLNELFTNRATNLRQSNLNVTVFTHNGTAYAGVMRGGSLEITTSVLESSADSDVWEYPVANTTEYQMSGQLLIPSGSNAFMAQAFAAGVESAPVNTVLTLGPASVTLPMTMAVTNHDISRDGGQLLTVNLSNRGAPVASTLTDVSTDLLDSILNGTAQLAWAVETGANNYSGTALITSTKFDWADAALITATHQFKNQGAPTVA